MQKEEVVDILSGLLRSEPVIKSNEYYVDVFIDNPMNDEDNSFYRYRVMENESIQLEEWIDNQTCHSIVIKNLRNIVWKTCKLDKVCNKYKKIYEEWKIQNNGISYIETNINDESDGKSQRSYEFMENFWKEQLKDDISGHGNLRLLLAEYGSGKSSYCQGVRNLVAKEIKNPFFNDNAAFPVVFDLNEFRSGDFDKFIETELFNKYGISMFYRIFEKLCQHGIFMVVLDAWDQMRGARQIFPINQDFSQMNSLWENKGKVLITCRRSFYQQQLKGNTKEIKKLSQEVGLYKLTGFDKASVIEYFQKDTEEKKKRGVSPLIHNEAVWVRECWELNNELFAKPLNLRLLVKHFKAINKHIDFKRQKADTYQFLGLVLDDWKKKNNVREESFLKELVSQTLNSGLNRSITLYQYKQTCEDDKWSNIISSLEDFDFVKVDEKKERIEFCLAAFQEFLWANFVLEELKTVPEKLNSRKALITNYLLIREVREWICKVLGTEEINCLKAQLDYVKYKSKEDVGYQGSNALTLLCDLNSVPFYEEQLDSIKSDLRRRPLMGVDFRGMDLSEANFYASDLEGADFSYTKLDKVSFEKTNLAQTRWREHGWMKKCAFLIQSNVLCVVAATSSGGILTYRVNDGKKKIVNLQNDVINDLAGDRGGIYTACSDGWVGYMDKSGNLRNAYIAESGLQSITYTKNESCVYVGADNQGIFRYNWNTGSKQKIEVDKILGNGMERIADIHYYSNNETEDYIAYTLGERTLLVLLRVTGMCKAEVVATSRLRTEGLQFEDICFADKRLIYAVVGRGIFGMSVEEALGQIPENELLSERQCLLSLSEAKAFSLSWASQKNRLMVMTKTDGQDIKSIYAINLLSDSISCMEIELDWFYNNYNYCIVSEKIEDFSISDDGEFAAVSGDLLAVFRNMGEYYALLGEPIEANISCKGVNLSKCKEISRYMKKFLESRGASTR